MSHAAPTWELGLAQAPHILHITSAADAYSSSACQLATPAWSIYCFRHSATLVLEGRAFELHAGSAVLIPPSVAHELLSREPGARLSARFTLPSAPESADV